MDVCNTSQDDSNCLSLLDAARNGQIDAMQQLIGAGANLNVKDSLGRTALILAAMNKSHDVVEFLLQSGADPDIRDKYGDTAFLHAVGETALRILEFTRNPNAHDRYVKNAALVSAVRAENVQLVKHFISFPAVVEKENYNDGNSVPALISAVQLGNVEIVQSLTESGININVMSFHKRFYGKNALMVAAEAGKTDLVRTLLRRGADINAQSILTEDTALSLAVNSYQSTWDVVDLLLQHGADTNVRDRWGDVVARQVERRRNLSLARMFQSYGINISIMNLITGDEGDVALSPLNWMDKIQGSQCQSPSNNREIICHLLQAGANANDQDVAGKTLLMKAAGDGDLNMVTEYVRYGVDLNLQDCSGRTALMWAPGTSESVKIVHFLIANGADVNLQDKEGYTALHWATDCLCEGTMRLLLEAGAEVDVSDNEGETPLLTLMQYTQECSFSACLDLLLEHRANAAFVESEFLHYFVAENDMERVSRLLTLGIAVETHHIDMSLLSTDGPPLSAMISHLTEQRPFSYKIFCRTSCSHFSTAVRTNFPAVAVPDMISPLQLAFCLELTDMVKQLVQLNVFTMSDISVLGGHSAFGDQLRQYCNAECVDLLEELCSQPLTLKTLSLLTVSTCIGWGLARKDRVERTGLPEPLQRCLLFR